MLLAIPGVLTSEQLAAVRKTLGGGRFVDGRRSAGLSARRVKHNQELEAPASVLRMLNNLVLGSLYRHPTFRSAALPHRLSGAFFARYTEGMS